MTIMFHKFVKTIAASLFGNTDRKRLILVAGLSGAGKTTLVHFMRTNTDANTDLISRGPTTTTITLYVEEPEGHRRRLVLDPIDLGAFCYRDHPGGTRGLWRDFLNTGLVDGVVFVIDSAEQETLDKAAQSLGEVLGILDEADVNIMETQSAGGGGEGSERQILRPRIPVLVLGNKIDCPTAVSQEELEELLELVSRSGCRLGKERGKREGEGMTSHADDDGESSRRPVKLFMCSAPMGVGYQLGFEWLGRCILSRRVSRND